MSCRRHRYSAASRVARPTGEARRGWPRNSTISGETGIWAKRTSAFVFSTRRSHTLDRLSARQSPVRAVELWYTKKTPDKSTGAHQGIYHDLIQAEPQRLSVRCSWG